MNESENQTSAGSSALEKTLQSNAPNKTYPFLMPPIEGDELRSIRRYLATRSDGLPWLFVSERQGRLSRFAVNYLVERTAKAAGLPDVHPHCLRHSCGYALADKGIDLRTIQEWLGHRSIEMTVRYTRISQKRFNGLWR